MRRHEIHKEICEKMNEVYMSKNADYGNAFVEVRKRHPNSVLIRLWDKLLRLDNLMSKGEEANHESIDDTLLDMANYAVMELVERRKETEDDANQCGRNQQNGYGYPWKVAD